MKKKDDDKWLKQKGYLHITPNIDVHRRKHELKRKIQNPQFVANYAFYPLIHAVIKDRKYKKIPNNSTVRKRGHSYWKSQKGGARTKKSQAKNRPLHYATHFDSLIYGYYAHELQQKYEGKLKTLTGVNESVIAYRKKPLKSDPDKGKSTIHFSNEAFQEIIDRNKQTQNPVAVLTFDIKSFFPTLNHIYLSERICDVLELPILPPDYQNVFKATTNFSYILKDELRLGKYKNGKRKGFDEKKLSKIKRKQGHKCYFESPSDFRKAVKEKRLRIYTKQFSSKGVSMGIPQGLPNSAIFANIYLLDFDTRLNEKIVAKLGAYYKRYSDDIIVVTELDKVESIKSIVYEEIRLAKLIASEDKTEQFNFQQMVFNNKGESRLTSVREVDGKLVEAKPLVYLGFEFRGYNTMIKASNVSKFYRRMIYAVKRKGNRMKRLMNENPLAPKAIFINQLKPIFLNYSLDKKPKVKKYERFVLNHRGEYDIVHEEKASKHNTNYYSYVERAANIIGDAGIKKQFRKVKNALYDAVKKQLK